MRLPPTRRSSVGSRSPIPSAGSAIRPRWHWSSPSCVAMPRAGSPGRCIRLGLGIGLVSATTVGLLHLGRSRADDRSLHALEHAGGLLGAGVGAPLRALLGSPGAVIVLLAAGVLGCLLIAGTGIRE